MGGLPISGFRAIFLLLFLASHTSWGWGSYGHEQINRAAAKALEKHPFGKWLNQNLLTVQRLSVTPDYDWKKVGLAPENAELADLRNQADRYEHPLHYFEADAFLPKGIVDAITAKILGLDIYSKIFPSYAKLRSDNEEYVVSIDPEKALKDISKPTAKEVTSHGTAPWRIAQLWKLGVNALKKKDFKGGIRYLGAMGHYVGDLSQPFHGTLDYDGKAHEPDAEGIHAGYETKLLEILAKAKGAKWDTAKKVWLNFDATEDRVVTATLLKIAKLPDLNPNEIQSLTGAAMRMVIETNPFVAPLEDAFAEAIQEANGDAATVTVATIKVFMKKQIGGGKVPKSNVTEAAVDQLSNGSAMLAKLWMAAYDAVKNEPGFDIAAAPKVPFTERLAIVDYPKPTYLPQVSKEEADSADAGPKMAAARSVMPQAAVMAAPKEPLFLKNRNTGDAHEPPKP